MKAKETGLCALLLLGLFGCDESMLRSTPETIPVPRVTQPYVAVFLSPASATVEVLLTRITPALGEGYEPDALGLPKATITLTRDDGQVLNVPNQSGIRHEVSHRGFVLAGRRYTLLVTTPDGNRLEGSCTVPVQNIDSQQVRVANLGDNRLRASWPDVTAQPDYYAVLNGSMLVNRRDTTFAAINSLFVLTDAVIAPNRRINSPVVNQAFDVPAGNPGINYNSITICRTDSAYFAYHKSVADIEAARQNPFAEPINLYSNVKGGYGIVAGYVGVRIVCKGERIVQIR